MARQPARTRERRAAANARYNGRQAAAAIVKTIVFVPADRIPELRAITLAWRQEAKLLLEADRPSADQILRIHSVRRTLGLKLPVEAFETRASAAQWLLAQEPALGAARPHTRRLRSTS